MTDNSNIHTAINAIMKDVAYVQKQKSGGLNYSFAGEAALISALRPPMVEHGVYMAVVGLADIRRGEYTTAKGSVMQLVDLTATIRFTHAPSGTSIDVVALGSGADTGDKASNKALTGAYKYALRQTFCIETGDDPDNASPAPRASKTQADPVTGEVKTNGNGNPPKPAGKLWERWAILVKEAAEFGITAPALDPAADDNDITKAGKSLAAQINAARAKQAQAN
jgi:hypothetical protein